RVALLRRPAPRFFFLWTPLLVGVTVAAGVAGLSPWLIAAVELATWVLIALCERSLSGPWPRPADPARVVEERPALPAAALNGDRGESAVSIRAPEVVAEPPATPPPAPAAALEPVPDVPAPPPLLPARAQPPATAASPGTATRWNVWRLEQVAAERAPQNEELAYLIVYLRDFADAEGLLPAGFDSLVRESFGDLLPPAG